MPIARIEKDVIVEVIENKRMAEVPTHKRGSFARVTDVDPVYDPSNSRLGAVTLTLVGGVVERSREVVPFTQAELRQAINLEMGVKVMALSDTNIVIDALVDQINAHSRIDELKELKETSGLSAEDEAELAELRAFISSIRKIRRSAHQLKQMDPIPADYMDSKYWQ